MQITIFAPIALLVATTGAAPPRKYATCKFPTDAGLVAIAPGSSNAGWAISPDRQCTPGNFCPYACPPGKLMNQWDPSATAYTPSQSQQGGLYCDPDGKVSKPFSDREYCMDGVGTVAVVNKADSDVSFCQTVLPGNEAMLIPNHISGGDTQTLAVPSPDYWAHTAAHYYINPLGVSAEEGCVWGTQDKPFGNWSPYVAGANVDEEGKTFAQIGWNPIYIESYTDVPNFGVRITCDDESACSGLVCEIDPTNGFNQVTSNQAAIGNGAAFCIVSARNLSPVKIEVFEV